MKICEYCKKEFEPNRKEQRFCCFQCGNLSRRKKYEPKYCKLCGKELTRKQIKEGNKFCGNSCSMKYKKANYTFKPMEYTKEMREKLSESMKKNWQNEQFRADNYKRMTKDNPMFKQENINKMMNSLAINGTKNTTNNFKAGNGKISEVEQIAYDILVPLGYLYNYAITMREVRLAYPEKHFANNYKPDFVNLRNKIVIEIDGSGHGGKHKIIDQKKEFALNYYGFKVYRFKNNFVKNNTEEFRKEIEKICMEN